MRLSPGLRIGPECKSYGLAALSRVFTNHQSKLLNVAINPFSIFSSRNLSRETRTPDDKFTTMPELDPNEPPFGPTGLAIPSLRR